MWKQIGKGDYDAAVRKDKASLNERPYLLNSDFIYK